VSDDKQFWKDLMGDDFTLSDFMDPERKRPEETPQPGGDEFSVPSSEENGGWRDVALPERPADTAGESAEVSESDFDVQIDYDDDGELDETDEYYEKPIHLNRERRTGCLGGILYFAFIVGVSFLLACGGWLAAMDVLGLDGKDVSVEMTVPEEYTIDEIADTLHESGLIKYKSLFKLYAGISKADKKITPGTYELRMDYDYRALVHGMTASGGTRVEIDVTIPEGFTLQQIMALLDKDGVCTAENLANIAANYDFDYDFLGDETLGEAKRLEGYLFPDTYTFYVGDTAERVFNKMLVNYSQKFTDDFRARAEELGYSEREIVIIASMIEREAGSDAERPDIASVIYNRLKSSQFPHLQIDATIYYAIAETGEEFSTDVDSPYNTYQCEGLPAGPISSPGLESIRAALYPSKTNYYYYALNRNGTHDFFESKSAFEAFINSDQYGG